MYVADYFEGFADNIRIIRRNRVSSYVGTLRRKLRDTDHETVGEASRVRLHEAEGLALLADGSLLVAVKGQDRIIRVSSGGSVTNLVGYEPSQFQGGLGKLWGPHDVKFHPRLGIVICESCNLLRYYPCDSRRVRVLTGQLDGGYQDGSLSDALFLYPTSLAIAENGHIFLADKDNNRIRAIVPEEGVFTVAGNGNWGKKDGSANEAEFSWPSKIVVASESTLFVTERGNDAIRCVRF